MTDMPNGYKQSEVGVIPEDWEVKTLGELGAWKGGMTPSMTNPAYWQNGTVPWISSGDVKSVQLKETGYCITKEAVKQGTTMMLPAESIVMVTRSGILRKYLPVATNVIPMAINQDIKALIPEKNINASFILHALTECGPRILSRCLKSGTTVESVEFTWLKAFAVPLPPLSEQRAIAAALSDVDELLAGLDRLIAKKRDLKQAAMQQLLTGQTRLQGFSDAWTLMRLGDHVTFLSHGTNSRAELQSDGVVKYLHYGDIHASSGVTLAPGSLPSLPESKARGLDRLLDGDLILADASEDLVGVSKSVEISGVGETELVAGLHTIAARFDKDILADGFKGYLQFCSSFSGHLRRLAAGTKVYATNRSHVASIEMWLPRIDEQTAIASVLSDMDAEIEALERRRAKTADMKQAMMQELLTGKTRLV